jgi:hypothetical protein
MKNSGKSIVVFMIVIMVIALLGSLAFFFLPAKGGFSSGDTTRWVASRYVIGQTAAMDSAQAAAIVSQPVEILAKEIQFQGQVCTNLVTQAETVKTMDYLAETWKATPEMLSIQQADLKVIKTNCDIPGFQEYMLLDGGKLMIGLDGVFFEFVPK